MQPSVSKRIKSPSRSAHSFWHAVIQSFHSPPSHPWSGVWSAIFWFQPSGSCGETHFYIQMEANITSPRVFPFLDFRARRFILRVINRTQLLEPWRSWKTKECFHRCHVMPGQELCVTSQQLPLMTNSNLQHLLKIFGWWIKKSTSFNENALKKRKLRRQAEFLLPLHLQTSTSLSVWVPASWPDAAELSLHHSCSHEAENTPHKKKSIQSYPCGGTKCIK